MDGRAEQRIADLQGALATSTAERDDALRLVEQERRQIDHLEHQLLFQVGSNFTVDMAEGWPSLK